MRAARIDGYGATPVVAELATPDVGPDEVLVRVRAASLNPLDVKLHGGTMHGYFPLSFPYVMGTDLAGTIEKSGPLAARFRQGDRVVARTDPTRGGALAEFAVVPASAVAAAPTAATLDEAAGIPTAAGTAWQAVHEVAEVKRGQTVLVHAGAGGVGSFLVQLARGAGARVIATASGSGLEIARRLGADRVIDHRAEDFAEILSDVDVVFDTVGGETQQRSFGVLRAGGTLIAIASPPDEALALAHDVEATFVFHQSDGRRLDRIVEAIDAGRLTILVDRTVPLDGLGEAFRYQGSGRARGKIILTLA